MTDDETILDLQTKITFLDRTVETLNEVVIEQGRELEVLRRRLELFEAKMQSGPEGDDQRPDPLLERPPHY
ncbi:MAG: SlyX family protein [Gammaproteobacteria bacterium]|nr:SlyX family protein [Gammaproteobacteria bacterium]